VLVHRRTTTNIPKMPNHSRQLRTSRGVVSEAFFDHHIVVPGCLVCYSVLVKASRQGSVEVVRQEDWLKVKVRCELRTASGIGEGARDRLYTQSPSCVRVHGYTPPENGGLGNSILCPIQTASPYLLPVLRVKQRRGRDWCGLWLSLCICLREKFLSGPGRGGYRRECSHWRTVSRPHGQKVCGG
jgi:hypothetical protein